MSQANVELIREAAAAFAQGGIEAQLRFYPPDVVWYPFSEWVEATEYRGHQGFARSPQFGPTTSTISRSKLEVS